MDTAAEASIIRLMRFVRGVVALGLAFAAGVGGVVALLKWLVGGSDLGSAMTEAVFQGWPFLGFIFGGVVATARALYETTGNIAYRAAVSVALGAAFILVWMSLGVGILGSDGDPADLMYVAVLAVGMIGAIIARFRANGMARALFATALAHALVVVIALIMGKHQAEVSSVPEVVILNGLFIVLFVGSAMLFRHAAREQTDTGGMRAD